MTAALRVVALVASGVLLVLLAELAALVIAWRRAALSAT